MIEDNEEIGFSNLFLLFPSTMDNKEKTKQLKPNIVLLLYNILPEQFREWNESTNFELRNLKLSCKRKAKVGKTVLKAMMYIKNVSNANPIRKADYLFSKM